MNNLIKNEITKIIKKKSFYIMLIIVLAYIVLSNVMNKYVYNNKDYNYYTEEYINIVKEEMENLNKENQQELDIYIGDKAEVDTYELLKQYDKESWQYKLISEKASKYLSDINTYTYKIKDEEALNEAKEKYNKFLERLKANDWKSFTQEEIDALKLTQEGLNEEYKDKTTDIQIETLEMRLKYDIPYGEDYRNEALNKYLQNKMLLIDLEKKNNKSNKNGSRAKKAWLPFLRFRQGSFIEG